MTSYIFILWWPILNHVPQKFNTLFLFFPLGSDNVENTYNNKLAHSKEIFTRCLTNLLINQQNYDESKRQKYKLILEKWFARNFNTSSFSVRVNYYCRKSLSDWMHHEQITRHSIKIKFHAQTSINDARIHCCAIWVQQIIPAIVIK